jgi:hypothetical protein
MGGDDFNPLKIDYGNPIFLNLNYTGKWNPLWVVFPENYTNTDWVSSKLLGAIDATKQDLQLFLICSIAPRADYVVGLPGPQRLTGEDRCTSGEH